MQSDVLLADSPDESFDTVTRIGSTGAKSGLYGEIQNQTVALEPVCLTQDTAIARSISKR